MDSKQNKSVWIWLAVILLLSVSVRAGIWSVYPFAHGNDTPTYQHLANSLRNNLSFERYNGTRTPGYPIFINLTGNENSLYLVQLGLGVLTTLLVFYISLQVSKNTRFSGIMALIHTLNLGQFFFDAAFLTECLATFLLFIIFAGILFLFNHQNTNVNQLLHFKTDGISLFIGISAAFLSMSRPLFAFVPFWAALYVLFFWQQPLKVRIKTIFFAALPALVVLLIWVNYIHTKFNIIGMDSIGGYHLVNHTSSFFELAPDKYSAIRDTFLKFRAERLASTTSPVNTIWDAIPQLMEQTHLNYYSLGRTMGEISKQLILDHPWLYLKNLVLGWWWFWKVGTFWLPESMKNKELQSILTNLMNFERMGLFGINLGFIAISISLLSGKIRRIIQPNLFVIFTISSVWVTSILQTLAEHGDNPRFLAPMQTLVMIIVVKMVMDMIKFPLLSTDK
ncbi:MAG: hypothetical protein WCP19_15510 [Chloroflexota bacterium]